MNHGSPIAVLLLRERSAVETYRKSLEIAAGSTENVLRRIRCDHLEAAASLALHLDSREHVFFSQDLDVWPGLSELTQPGSTTVALTALLEGERCWLRELEEELQVQALGGEARELIAGAMIPKQRDHIASLERLLVTAG